MLAKFSRYTVTSLNPVEWPVTKVVLSRLKDENGGKVYQGSELHDFRDTTTKGCADEALADLKSLDDKMRDRLKWSDIDPMRSNPPLSGHSGLARVRRKLS